MPTLKDRDYTLTELLRQQKHEYLGFSTSYRIYLKILLQRKVKASMLLYIFFFSTKFAKF